MKYNPLVFGTTEFASKLTKEQAMAYMRSVIATLRAQGYFHQVGREEGEMAIFDQAQVLCKIVQESNGTYSIRGLATFQEEFREQLPYI